MDMCDPEKLHSQAHDFRWNSALQSTKWMFHVSSVLELVSRAGTIPQFALCDTH